MNGYQQLGDWTTRRGHPGDPRDQKEFDLAAEVNCTKESEVSFSIICIGDETYLFAPNADYPMSFKEYTFEELFKVYVSQLYDDTEWDDDYMKELFAEHIADVVGLEKPLYTDTWLFYDLNSL